MSVPRLAGSLGIAVMAVVLSTGVAIASFPMIADGTALQVYLPGRDKGITLPRAIGEVKPQYTAAALQKRIQGAVWMTTVIQPSGNASDIKVTQSLDAEYGLDDEAVKALRQWKFEPGRKDGKAVSVQVTIEMRFTLK